MEARRTRQLFAIGVGLEAGTVVRWVEWMEHPFEVRRRERERCEGQRPKLQQTTLREAGHSFSFGLLRFLRQLARQELDGAEVVRIGDETGGRT